MKLYENTPYYNEEWGMDPTITSYLAETNEPRGAVIVLPGGGYEMLAPHEGEPYARLVNGMGAHAFVATYRLSPYKHPVMLYDVLRAVRFVRAHAKEWNINPKKIAVMGSSAGGHAAAMAACHFDAPLSYETDAVDALSGRPDACILCYPVVTMGEFTHEGSKKALLGEAAPEELIRYASLEKNISPDTPPFFIWHTAADDAVPVENSLQLSAALSAAHIPFEAHIFPYGHHGLGIAEDHPHVAQWGPLLQNWLHLLEF